MRSLTDSPDLLTVDEVADLLRIGRNQAYQAVHSGEIPSIRLGRSIRIPKAGLERLLAARPSEHPN